jgi:hypothetical protein
VGAALSVVVVVFLARAIIRVATTALVMTGMSRESARFQARSAFLGVGFTTAEAESVVNHPLRRRIVMWLMWIGNAGIITVLGGLVISFSGDGSTWARVATIVGGLVLLTLLARSPLVTKTLERVIQRALCRFGGLDVRDYAGLLHVGGGWTIDELRVREDDWLAGRTLGELGLRDEGLLVLGIDRRNGDYAGAPHPSDEVRSGDTLVIYGQRERIAELDRRGAGAAGDRAHEQAVAAHLAAR